MKALIVFFMLLTQVICADDYVRGYTRSNGTYVQPHYRSSANSIKSDNYSYPGNYNPNTGRISGYGQSGYYKGSSFNSLYDD